jgi:hypothetical protein
MSIPIKILGYLLLLLSLLLPHSAMAVELARHWAKGQGETSLQFLFAWIGLIAFQIIGLERTLATITEFLPRQGDNTGRLTLRASMALAALASLVYTSFYCLAVFFMVAGRTASWLTIETPIRHIAKVTSSNESAAGIGFVFFLPFLLFLGVSAVFWASSERWEALAILIKRKHARGHRP